MDTILRGYDVPKLYFRKVSQYPYEHEVADGQQRLVSIWEFYDGRLALGEDSEEEYQSKRYGDLLSDVQDKIDLFPLTVVEIEDATEEEIQNLLLRLQS